MVSEYPSSDAHNIADIVGQRTRARLQDLVGNHFAYASLLQQEMPWPTEGVPTITLKYPRMYKLTGANKLVGEATRLYELKGEYARAKQLLLAAQGILWSAEDFSELERTRSLVPIEHHFGLLHGKQEEYDTALVHFSHGVTLAFETGMLPGIAEGMRHTSSIVLRHDDPDPVEALHLSVEAYEIALFMQRFGDLTWFESGVINAALANEVTSGPMVRVLLDMTLHFMQNYGHVEPAVRQAWLKKTLGMWALFGKRSLRNVGSSFA